VLKRKRALLALLTAVLPGLAFGSDPVPNWSAPSTWSPPRSSHRFSTLSQSEPLPFVAVTPCRIADTRGNGFGGAYGPPSLAADANRTFTITGQCGIPAFAAAVSLNFAALNIPGPGDLRVFPAGSGFPLVSTMNYNANSPNLANAAIVALGTGGAITVHADAVSVDLLIDVNGYYSTQGIVNGLNGLFGNITLAAGMDLTLTPSGQTLTLSANSTSADEPNTLVRRDGSRSFSAGTVTLSGNLVLPFPNSASSGTVYQGSTRFLYTLGPSSASVFLGPAAGNFMINGTVNTAVGDSTLTNDSSGGANTAIGGSALFHNTVGNFNTAVGAGTLNTNLNGFGNTAIGTSALVFNSSGNSNIAVGIGAGANLTTGSNNIDIFDAGVAGESNTIRIGRSDTQTATYIAGISGTAVTGAPVIVDGNGQLGVATSSGRFKRDIQEIGDASDGLLKLRPVSFRYKAEIDPAGLEQYGLIAEEVERVYPELVTCDAAGQPQTIRYHLLVPMLLNETQKDRKEIQDLKARLKRLEALISTPAR
jgi:hypothetical protein